jgi:hypothetical protein
MKTTIVFFILLLLSIANLNAQWGDANCPGDSSSCTEWDSTVVNQRVQLSHVHDQYAFVTYKFRYCNGVLEIKIESINVIDNAGYLRAFNIEHYEFASLRSVIELGLITEHDVSIGIDSLGLATNCSDTVSWVSFYSASCGIFVTCRYERATDRRDCDSGFAPPYPDVPFGGNIVEVSRWQSCGRNCCKRTYKICRGMSSNPNIAGNDFQSIPMLRIVSTNIESISWCSEQGKYDKTCYTNCWNTP